MNLLHLFTRKQPTPTPKPWPEQLYDSSHCWHVASATPYDLTLNCCSCDASVMLDCPEPGAHLAAGGEFRHFLRYSLMQGPRQVAIGRGFLLGSCGSGSRRLALDGYPVHSCTLTSDDPFLRKYGLEGEGLVRPPEKSA